MSTKSLYYAILLVLIFHNLLGNAQYSSPLGTWNTYGTPNYLTTDDTLPSDYLQNLIGDGGVIEEYQNNSAWVDENEFANLDLIDTTQVWVTFLGEGAGWYNSLGFYTYPTGTPPSSVPAITNKAIIFANASGVGANSSATNYAGGGELNFNDRVYIGQFPSGTTIGWYVVANGWNTTYDSVTNGNHIVYSNHNLNPESSASLKPHNIFMWDASVGKYLLSFEDQRRDGSTDNDFNDCVFMVTTIEKETGTPLPPPEGIPELDEEGTPLPVEISEFSGLTNDSKIILSWTTLTESNNNYFKLLKSVDGRNYKEFANVNGAGNSNTPISYSFTDETPYEIVTYYKLTQVDFNGKENIAGVITIDPKNSDNQALVSYLSPNPNSSNTLRLQLEAKMVNCSVNLVNTNGSIVLHEEISGDFKQVVSIDISKLEKGYYTVVFTSGNKVQRFKLLKH